MLRGLDVFPSSGGSLKAPEVTAKPQSDRSTWMDAKESLQFAPCSLHPAVFWRGGGEQIKPVKGIAESVPGASSFCSIHFTRQRSDVGRDQTAVSQLGCPSDETEGCATTAPLTRNEFHCSLSRGPVQSGCWHVRFITPAIPPTRHRVCSS
jgi:hypothetical protein